MIKKVLKIGLIGALIGSLCCITPIVIILLGLGSLSFALSFSQYKHLFLSLGILFVLTAILFNVRKKGSVCAVDKEELKKKKLMILIIMLIMAFFYLTINYIILPYITKILYN